jgi:transcriptional regulator with XRE-family HTH domain
VGGKSTPTFSQRLKQAREAAGMTQQELAFASGLSLSMIAQLEQGAKTDPRMSTLTALAAALGVSVDHLTGVGTAAAPPPRRRRRKGE